MEDKALSVFQPNLPITREDLKVVEERRAMLIEFIRKQMRVGIDFGTIPGCKNPSLYKPGAEKLGGAFKVGVRFVDEKENIDLHQNFAMFSYKAQAFDKVTSNTLGELWGSCNSQENKYRTRKIYDKKTRMELAEEETPIGDIMNTLQKMAQKRAYVGVVIQVVGASDFYTQDIDDPDDAAALGIDPNRGGNPAKRAQGKVPNATSASSQSESSPPCCNRPMMVSKRDPNTFYCVICKTSLPRQAPVRDVGGN